MKAIDRILSECKPDFAGVTIFTEISFPIFQILHLMRCTKAPF